MMPLQLQLLSGTTLFTAGLGLLNWQMNSSLTWIHPPQCASTWRSEPFLNGTSLSLNSNGHMCFRLCWSCQHCLFLKVSFWPRQFFVLFFFRDNFYVQCSLRKWHTPCITYARGWGTVWIGVYILLYWLLVCHFAKSVISPQGQVFAESDLFGLCTRSAEKWEGTLNDRES